METIAEIEFNLLSREATIPTVYGATVFSAYVSAPERVRVSLRADFHNTSALMRFYILQKDSPIPPHGRHAATVIDRGIPYHLWVVEPVKTLDVDDSPASANSTTTCADAECPECQHAERLARGEPEPIDSPYYVPSMKVKVLDSLSEAHVEMMTPKFEKIAGHRMKQLLDLGRSEITVFETSKNNPHGPALVLESRGFSGATMISLVHEDEVRALRDTLTTWLDARSFHQKP